MKYIFVKENCTDSYLKFPEHTTEVRDVLVPTWLMIQEVVFRGKLNFFFFRPTSNQNCPTSALPQI